MLARAGLGEEGVECIIATTDCLVAWPLTIRLNTVLQTEELPASIADLNTTLSEVKAEDLTHDCRRKVCAAASSRQTA